MKPGDIIEAIQDWTDRWLGNTSVIGQDHNGDNIYEHKETGSHPDAYRVGERQTDDRYMEYLRERMR